MLRLALPSEGELQDPSLLFLKGCGLPVERASARAYMGEIAGLDEIHVMFQRNADITAKVEDGSAELGILGKDRFLEVRRDASNAIPLIEDLGYGRCELVLGIPEGWMDILAVDDLVELSLEFRRKGRELRVATKYPRLVQKFLLSRGITYFSLVQASGTIEAAPAMGYADIIADISASGVTLRENKLRTIAGGTILKSQACLIGNRRLLKDSEKLAATRTLLELFEGHLRAESFYSVTANLQGASASAIGKKLLAYPEVSGIKGPTVARVYSRDGHGWYSVTVAVKISDLPKAIERLRELGSNGMTVLPAHYVFVGECNSYQRLLEALERPS